jgi:DNA-binding transcriptional LysR family regulator
MDRLDRLRLFVAVADHGSFVVAARELRVSPTVASRAIKALERELGIALLLRTTRSVRLTGEGAAFLERCSHALAELDEARREIEGGAAEPRGLLVVTAPTVLGRIHVRPILVNLLRNYPNLRLRLLLTDRLVRLVEEGVDIAIRIAELADSTLLTARLGTVRRVLVASPDYLARRGTPAAPAALSDHDLLLFEGFAPAGELHLAPTHPPIACRRPRFETNSVEATIDMVLDGCGIAQLMSYQVADAVAAGRLVLLFEDYAPPPIPVSAVFPANRRRSPSVRAFLEAARAHFEAVLSP